MSTYGTLWCLYLCLIAVQPTVLFAVRADAVRASYVRSDDATKGLRLELTDDVLSLMQLKLPPAGHQKESAPSKATKTTWILAILGGVLAIAAVWAVFDNRVKQRSSIASLAHHSRSDTGFLGLKSSFHYLIFVAYVVFSSMHMFLQHNAGSTGYSVIAATVLVYFSKFGLASTMFFVRGTGKVTEVLYPCQGTTRFGRIPICILAFLPGACLGCYDVLSFISLAKLDPVTYQVFLHTRLAFIAIAWQFTFRTWLSPLQWFSLGLFALAATVKGIDQAQENGQNAISGLVIAAIQILFAVVGNVSSELLLKEVTVHTDLLNMINYFWGLVVLVFSIMCAEGGAHGLYSDLLAPSAWQTLLADKWMVSSIVCLMFFGIITAYFLRELSNLLKELSSSFVIIGTAAVQWLVLGVIVEGKLPVSGTEACTPLGIEAVILACLALAVYNIDPLSNMRKPKS